MLRNSLKDGRFAQPSSPSTQQPLQVDAVSADEGHGRVVTPEYLHARRAFYEQCAFLSTEAALLATLVDRIGRLERIVVRPGELIEDLRKRLDPRDAPGPLNPHVIGSLLRRLGFVPVGRDGRGWKYEIRWDQLWVKDPRALNEAGFDPSALSGRELLRLLAEDPNSFFAPHVWCSRCERVTAILWGDWKEGLREWFRCSACDGPVTLLEEGWRRVASKRIRHAIQGDPALLSRVKMKWEELHDGAPFPRLPEPFGWFDLAWKKAGKPPGRPSSVLVRYHLAHIVGRLESAGLSCEQIQEVFLERNKKRRFQIYDNYPDRVHRFLGSEFRNSIGAAPIVSRPDQLWRRVQWARRQWTNPMDRLREERLNAPTAGRQSGQGSTAVPAPGSSYSSKFRFVHEIGISGRYR